MAHKIRIYPTPEQAAAFARIAGCCRLVYNLGLEQRRTFWRQYRRQTGKSISLAGQRAEITAMKAEADFLKEVPAHCLQMALVALDEAFSRFFSGLAGYPKPRKKFENDSFIFPDPEQFRILPGKNLLVLPKFGKTAKDNGPIRAVFHRQITGRAKRVTISREGNAWYASILVSMRVRKHRRRDMIHQITSTIAKNHRVVVIEKLQIANMTASARGTPEEPGHKVAQKSGLNRSILDSGWGELRRQLAYKLAWRGGTLVEVPPQHTSCTCPACKVVAKESRISRDLFRCVSCRHTVHADIAASLEIRDRGLHALGIKTRLEPTGQAVEPSVRDMAEAVSQENTIRRRIHTPAQLAAE